MFGQGALAKATSALTADAPVGRPPAVVAELREKQLAAPQWPSDRSALRP